MNEQTYRRGRGGVQARPFASSAEVECRAYSAPLQRVLTDFGAEQSFARAAARVREHYGVEVGQSAVRRITEAHAEQFLAQEEVRREWPERAGVACVIGQMDGSLIPIVSVAEQSACDRRTTRTVSWQEARLALARAPGSLTPRYAATLGSVEQAGDCLLDCALRVGAGAQTHVHGVGDGAPWISEQVERCFGAQAAYLVDFYHVSEYLSAAGVAIAGAGAGAQAWRQQQQERLKQNQLAEVLRALESHLEPETSAVAPVRSCYRYLSNRREQLNYRDALAAALPIGSGEIESAHRHVVQARLKLAGAWWQRENAAKMLALRVARANGQWQAYWQQQRQEEVGI